MGSAASYVYTNLGLVELERWTKLNKAYQACRQRLADGATFEQEVDEVTSLSRLLQEIETKAKVPKDMMTS